MKKLLVCEDESAIREFEVITLRRAGYEVVDTSCGEDAIKAFNAAPNDFSVVLLDIMMPGIDGFTVCKKIREKNSRVGIIMLSAKTQEMDKVNGLMLGADDYVTKPFSPSELAARVDAICRRISAGNDAPSDILKSGPFTLSLLSRTLTKNGKIIDLTQVEFQLMELFMSNAETALERKQILVRIWGESYNGDDKIVDVNIRRLRMKIEDEPSNPAHLQTVWGYGYKWMP
ncbi:MAG: response regulator transcription factor [Oscillospiraceae bacterium]|nr:response regulator transcription factor [Oscillospiraceae bacterium]